MTKHTIRMIGKKFNRVKVLSFNGIYGCGGHAYWNCICKCGKKFTTRGSHLRTGQVKDCGCVGKLKSSKRLKKYANSKLHRGSNNPMWKGNNLKYSSFHGWLSRHFKKEYCEHCKIKNKIFDWALKKGHKYTRYKKDYLCLCRSCHIKYDFTKERAMNAHIRLLKTRKIYAKQESE